MAMVHEGPPFGINPPKLASSRKWEYARYARQRQGKARGKAIGQVGLVAKR